MGDITYTSSSLERHHAAIIHKIMQQMQTQKPKAPSVKDFDDVDLMMELISRGYAVYLPVENAEKVK